MNDAPTTCATSEVPTAKTIAPRQWSLIWLLPAITAVVIIVLAVQSLTHRGVLVEITFTNAAGLVAGESAVRYQGVQIGYVESLSLLPDLDGVLVRARVDRSAQPLLRRDTAFWIVRPKVGLQGVSGLDTLVSGAYIDTRPGPAHADAAQTRTFTGLNQPPPGTGTAAGLRVVLSIDRLGSLRAGAPVYYREIQVGQVDRCELASTADQVLVYVHIVEPYAPLVRENTVFWNASGVDLSMGWLGPKLRAESLASILAGGIGFATPDNDEMGEPVGDGARFVLHDEPRSSWLKWQPTIELSPANRDPLEP